MNDSGLDIFHLSYVPAPASQASQHSSSAASSEHYASLSSSTASGNGSETGDCSTGDGDVDVNGINSSSNGQGYRGPVHRRRDGLIVREATSLQLCRCYNHRQKHMEGKTHFDSDVTACHCCCCNAAKNSVDWSCKTPLPVNENEFSYHLPIDSFSDSKRQNDDIDVRGNFKNLKTEGVVGSDVLDDHAEVLAVLVPPSLTKLFDLSRDHVTENVQTSVSEKLSNFPVACAKHQREDDGGSNEYIGDDELRLLKSIHPCLCSNGRGNDNHFHDFSQASSLKSDEEFNNSHSASKKEQGMLNPCLPLRVNGIISFGNDRSHYPADVVLLSPQLCQYAASTSVSDILSHYCNLLNNETASEAPWAVLKAFPVSSISILPYSEVHHSSISTPPTASAAFKRIIPNSNVASSNPNTFFSNVSNAKYSIASLPCCPVCIHRIDPIHLGLPKLKAEHKCSSWCSTPCATVGDKLSQSFESTLSCINEMKLLPWPFPSTCAACQIICERDYSTGRNANSSLLSPLRQQGPLTSSSQVHSPLVNSPDSNPPLMPAIVPIETAQNQYDNPDIVHSHSINSTSSVLSLSPPSLKRAPSAPLSCNQCGMTTTLWVCLTCGIVGCGRYTLKHAEQHYDLTRHPYSLELATRRIWDYEKGTFAHRRDLLECPVLSMKWGGLAEGTASRTTGSGGLLHGEPMADGRVFSSNSIQSPLIAASPSAAVGGIHSEGKGSTSYLEHNSHSLLGNASSSQSYNSAQHSHHSSQISSSDSADFSAQCHTFNNPYNSIFSPLFNDASYNSAYTASSKPKKAIMISQEYEILLRSALEDQSQHFEGEISRLRAELASSRLQHVQNISDRESREIEALRIESDQLRIEIDELSSSLVEAQAEEAKLRATSQRLLREQSISKDLLEKLHKETRLEHDLGKQRVEDLELQIEDLMANLRMRTQFAKDEELSQAQIFGTIGGGKSGGKGKRGKKSRRK